MMSKDLLLYENGSGGEIFVLNNDLTLVENLYQQVYLMLFGGNLEASTTGSEAQNEQRLDWWGNSLLFKNKPEKQFNSSTERMLDNVVLNSSGRIDIKRAIESDLQPLSKIANISVEVYIVSDIRLKIKITIQKPGILEDKALQFIWDNASKEIILVNNI